MQAHYKVKPWKQRAAKAKALPHDAFDQIALGRTPHQFFCHNDAHASRIEFIGSIVHNEILAFYGPPKSKNG